ncbi:hypothetical protein OBP_174 [Pseudomonas phage OBP]|uniref:hypothetical protein n=1 Tax=Pseudomonas phage OBP TaxID=1124849 RepID=UPI000240D58E|nr:hypothetical protein OBP_174 [Pseudomonas phage OBP]AEV89611.1 hypothetical protein OBP_174 [Pseudomonas phage OBP]
MDKKIGYITKPVMPVANWEEELKHFGILSDCVTVAELESIKPIRSDYDSWIFNVPTELMERINARILEMGITREEAETIVGKMVAWVQYSSSTGAVYELDSVPKMKLSPEFSWADFKPNPNLHRINADASDVEIKGVHLKSSRPTARDKVMVMLATLSELELQDDFPGVEHDVLEYVAYWGNDDYVMGADMGKYLESVTIDGKAVHPRHYIYCKPQKAVIWLGYELLRGNRPQVVLKHDPENDLREFIGLPDDHPLKKGVLALARENRVTGKTLYREVALSGGFPLGRSFAEPCTEQFVDDRPETIKGNSRQRIVDNGKHKWPAAKTRKGHRK